MDIRMNYDDGVKYMKNKCEQGSDTFLPERAYSELTITYPGYKGKGDYRVKISPNPTPPTHFNVCEYLYHGVAEKKWDYHEIVALLEDVYQNGTDIDVSKYNLDEVEKLITILFWMTLQDEINYPQPYYQGRRMPFSRYFEAIHCAAFGCRFTIEDIERRCNNIGNRPIPYSIKNAPSFYYL